MQKKIQLLSLDFDDARPPDNNFMFKAVFQEVGCGC